MYDPDYENNSYLNSAVNPLSISYPPMNNNSINNNNTNINPQELQNIASQGRYGDTILAHINPIEAGLLMQNGGSGTINPNTGLPEFFFKGVRNFLKNPSKTTKKTFKNPRRTIADVLGTAGAVFGGPVGGAISGGVRSAIRGDGENPLIGALKGLGYGYTLPKVAGFAGSGITSLTGNNNNVIANLLNNYSNNSQGNYFGMLSSLSNNNSPMGVAAGEEMEEYVPQRRLNSRELGGFEAKKADKGFFDTLMNNSKGYLSKPANLISTALLANSFLNRPKEKTPERLALDDKRFKKASMLNPQELAAEEAYQLAQAQSARRIARNKYLPEERIGVVEPRYVRTHTPEEYENLGRWLTYYNNPEFQGNPLAF